MPKDLSIKKVLVIGSGPIVIGQAAEFDYAGAQACRILREEGINVVLVNSNPATIMTDKHLADEIYLEPLTIETSKRIIEKERPDGILSGLGGQTGLTLSMQLYKEGILDKYGVRLLGSDINAIDKAEDRKLFRDMMKEIGEPVVPSEIATTLEESIEAAKRIGYPVIVRPAFTLGGSGGGIAKSEDELKIIAENGLDLSPITQVLIEKCIAGYKEIEFETMRDSIGNVIAICSMENLDPVGVHTGDSIVTAPALTLSDKEYQMLRSASLKIISSLGIVGGCNCQFALDPESMEYAVIEVNPRVSRSSALASKATGYPIAKITTKIALGYTLDEIKNDITGKTCACFEPTLDYVVCKFPKWPFDKFNGSSRTLGTQMKATGEVMSIATSFEMALMKAVRGAEIGLDTLNAKPLNDLPLVDRLKEQNDHRIFTVFEALKNGISVDEIHEITKIDEWYLEKINNLAKYEMEIADKLFLTEEEYYKGKKLGYTDKAIKRISGAKDVPGIEFSYNMVDTCGGEFSAVTPYFYSTVDDTCESRRLERSGKPVVMVLGSGPIRIGQGIEFDYSSVHSVWTLRELGYDVVTINNNPETVSTDYDISDRLYFEPLTEEDVMNVIKVEKPIGVVVAFGGQTAIKLAGFLEKSGIRILGTSQDSIDLAEDRERFDKLLEEFNIFRPKGMGVRSLDEALNAANSLGYPVLLRPSYVIGGQNMTIARDDKAVITYMDRILSTGIDNPVLVDKYMPGIELEVDCISDSKDVLIPGIMEHIERAGIHSGDSIAVYPPYNLTDNYLEKIKDVSIKLALALKTKGLVNIQYLIYEGELYVIEVNPRASRTVPYISKVTNVPMVDLASKVMLGESLESLGYGTGLYKVPPYFAVKVPVFSFEKLNDANSILGPEMKSTGEVLGIGKSLPEALFKGLKAAGFYIPTETERKSTGVLLSVSEHDYDEVLGIAKRFFDEGIKLYATTGTASYIKKLGIDCESIKNATESDDIYTLLESGKINYIIYTGAVKDDTFGDYIKLHKRAMQLMIPCLTSLDTANALLDIIESNYTESNTELVDINSMRKERVELEFYKMHSCSNDYILIPNFDNRISFASSLAVEICKNHTGIIADGVVLMEKSDIADSKMEIFNKDGSKGITGGNAIRMMAKCLYDNKIVTKKEMTIEVSDKILSVKVYTKDDKVTSATVDMGIPSFDPKIIPIKSKEEYINKKLTIDKKDYYVTCLSIGNPHCVTFLDSIDDLDLEKIGPLFEHNKLFPERTNTEFAKIVNQTTVRLRVFERGNGETLACGTGAIATVIAGIKNDLLKESTDITVKLKGGDLIVNYDGSTAKLNGETKLVYKGVFEY